MTEFIHVHTTTDSREEAQKIAETVVARRLAACCWISSPITGIYWWKGKMEQSEEWVCSMKTRKELYDELEQAIKAIHSYEEPAIVATPFVAGSQSYFDWIMSETMRQQ